ncbi:MAG: hypothetical protein ACI36Y_01740 [Coriobacteriales bacterium]
MKGHTGVPRCLCSAALLLRGSAPAAVLACCLACAPVALGPQQALADEFSPAAVSLPPNFIDKQEAKMIALDHVGLKPRQVDALKVRLGRYNGKKAYMVKFQRKQYRYDYCVRAKNGKILFYNTKHV